MDYIKKFDFELEKEYYYAGEKLKGWVVIHNFENLKVRGVRVFLRGKAHVEWKVTRSGERRTVKEDHYFMDDKSLVWGKDTTEKTDVDEEEEGQPDRMSKESDNASTPLSLPPPPEDADKADFSIGNSQTLTNKGDDGSIPIMPRGEHRYGFEFQLPESALPCSFESKIGTIRYYLRVIIDIPYASPPQGLKYFTIIGPHIDCMDERYLVPMMGKETRRICCLCCQKGPVTMEATLERSAYCCGEHIKVKAEIQNGTEENVWLICRLMQHVEYKIHRGALGLTKEVSHKVWEYRGSTVPPHTTRRFDDLARHLQVPIMPPTLAEICRVIDIYYVLRVCLGMEKSGEDLPIDFGLDIATMPFRIPNSPSPPVKYEVAAFNVEGGLYISPEFQLGQVYDGSCEDGGETVLYRPVYICVPHDHIQVTNSNNASATVATAAGAAGNQVQTCQPTASSSSHGKELTSEMMTSV